MMPRSIAKVNAKSIDGYFGVGTSCFFIRGTILSDTPIDGDYPSLSFMRPGNVVEIASFDGVWAVATIKTRAGNRPGDNVVARLHLRDDDLKAQRRRLRAHRQRQRLAVHVRRRIARRRPLQPSRTRTVRSGRRRSGSAGDAARGARLRRTRLGRNAPDRVRAPGTATPSRAGIPTGTGAYARTRARRTTGTAAR